MDIFLLQITFQIHLPFPNVNHLDVIWDIFKQKCTQTSALTHTHTHTHTHTNIRSYARSHTQTGACSALGGSYCARIRQTGPSVACRTAAGELSADDVPDRDAVCKLLLARNNNTQCSSQTLHLSFSGGPQCCSVPAVTQRPP